MSTAQPQQLTTTDAPKTAKPTKGLDVETLKSKFENEEQIRSFFRNNTFEKYWYVNFNEFKYIFGDRLDEDALGRVKKYWAEINVTYFNTSYELLWYVKWVPVVVKYATNLMRLRLMGALPLLIYLEAVDFLLEPMITHFYKYRRIVRLSEAFDYHLTKGKYQEMRMGWLEKYLNCLQNNIEAGVKLGADRDRALVKRINRAEKSELFETIDEPSAVEKKDDQILFKKEIDDIKRQGVPEYIRKNFDADKLKQYLARTVLEVRSMYFDYKRTAEDFPKRKDFETCLHPNYFPGERLMTFSEELRGKTRRVARMIDYVMESSSTENILTNLGIIKEEEVEKKDKRRLRLQSNVADWLLFSAVFIIPFKGARILKNFKLVKYKLFDQNKI